MHVLLGLFIRLSTLPDPVSFTIVLLMGNGTAGTEILIPGEQANPLVLVLRDCGHLY